MLSRLASASAGHAGSWSYRGLVNDVRIYDGALNEEDIKKIYQEKMPQPQATQTARPVEVQDDIINK